MDEHACFDLSDYSLVIEGPTRVNLKQTNIDEAKEADVELDSLLPKDDEYNPKDKPGLGPVSNKPPGYFLELWRPTNISLMLSFFTVGLIGFASTAITFYLIKERNASPIQLSCLASVVSLPWALKIFVGIYSDGFPLFGYRRKPLIIFGWTGFSVCNLMLSFMTDPAKFSEPPTINTIILFSFLASSFMIVADVANDALCVERSKFEKEVDKGKLQTSGYSSRAAGSILASIAGALVYNKAQFGWGLTISQIYMIEGLIPLCIVLPLTWPLIEISSGAIPFESISDQFIELWNIVQMRCLWQPMAFIFLFNMLTVPNAAYQNFLLLGLGLSPLYMGVLDITATIITLFAMILYQKFLFSASIRSMYIINMVLGIVFTVFQYILILRLNIAVGFPDIAYLVCLTVFGVMVSILIFVPTITMYVSICPEGSEGTTFALLTTIGNIGSTVSSDIGTLFLKIWDCSNDAIKSGNYTGVENLVILTACTSIIPIFFVWLLPESKEYLLALKTSGEKNKIGGIVVLSVLVVSIIFTVALNLYILLSPGQSEVKADE